MGRFLHTPPVMSPRASASSDSRVNGAASMQQPAAWMRRVVVLLACTALAPACILDWEREDDGGSGGGGAGEGGATTATTASTTSATTADTSASTSTGGGECDPATCRCISGGVQCGAGCEMGVCKIGCTGVCEAACGTGAICEAAFHATPAGGIVHCESATTCTLDCITGAQGTLDCGGAPTCTLDNNPAVQPPSTCMKMKGG